MSSVIIYNLLDSGNYFSVGILEIRVTKMHSFSQISLSQICHNKRPFTFPGNSSRSYLPEEIGY